MQLSKEEWDGYLKAYPDAHLLQLSEWGELKSHFGWTPLRIGNQSAGAQILFRALPFGYSIAYIPKGPLGQPDQAFWVEIDQVCRAHKAIFLKVELDRWEADPDSTGISLDPIFFAAAPIQPIQTVVLDLTGGEEAVLARMKQKTRYNIHLAEKKEVEVQPWRDFGRFGQMMNTTSQRDGFGVHQSDYYRLAYEHFAQKDACELFCAQFQGIPLAAVMVFRQGRRAWYFYGASSNEERNRMPAYLVQWQAIRWAIANGCAEYDLWGIPDAPEQELEDQFTQRADGLWGVYRFKRGFGGEIKRTTGAFDRVYSKPMYSLYRWYLRIRNRTGAME